MEWSVMTPRQRICIKISMLRFLPFGAGVCDVGTATDGECGTRLRGDGGVVKGSGGFGRLCQTVPEMPSTGSTSRQLYPQGKMNFASKSSRSMRSAMRSFICIHARAVPGSFFGRCPS